MSYDYNGEWDSCSFLTRWTFSVAYPMLNHGKSSPLQFDTLMQIPEKDRASKLLPILKKHYKNSRKVWFMPRLMVALFKTSGYYCYIVAIGTMAESSIRIALPVILILLLQALQANSAREAYIWAGVMGFLGFLQTVVHHVLFFYSMRCGWNWKNACTALIHDQLFNLKIGTVTSASSGTGMLVNLISNDVSRFEEFSVYACFSWEALIEVVAILVILIFFLDVASAVAGVGISFLFVPLMIVLAKKFAKYRSQTAAATDQRVRYISEIIDGIASVKSYAWETPLFQAIRKLRSKETEYIAKSQRLRAINLGLLYCIPAMVSFVTFSVYWGRGGTLTIPKVFATLSMLQTLRLTLGAMWTKAIERGSEAIASCNRIEAFLNTVQGWNGEDDINDNERVIATTIATQDIEQAPTTTTVVTKKSKSGEVYESINTPQKSSNNSSDNSNSNSNKYDDNNNNDNTAVEMKMNILHATTNTILFQILPSSYYYGVNKESPVINNISFSVDRGEILMVVGPVGSGKSTLLSAVLGEINCTIGDNNSNNKNYSSFSSNNNDCRVFDSNMRVAYCAQKPWILASSVKSNIALANKNNIEVNYKQPKNIDPVLYKLAVESCLIVDDLMQWPAYDDTEVGERGISISGGQKARISLARAVYSDADLYVLDDPLSAVDAHVGKALYFHCIQGALRDRNKGVILVTHQLQYLKYATKILVLNKDGNQVFYGNYHDLLMKEDVVGMLEIPHDSSNSNVDDIAVNTIDRSLTPSPTPVDESTTTENNKSPDNSSNTGSNSNNSHHNMKAIKAYDPNYRLNHQLQQQNQAATLQKNSSITFNTKSQDLSFVESEEDKQRRQIVSLEDRAIGDISWNVYWNYITSGGILKGLGVIGIFLFSQVLAMITDYWLRWWANESFGSQRDNKYIIIFGILMGSCVLLGFFRAIRWFKFTLTAATILHEKCLWAVMHSPLRFFIANPTGRILNRFAKDQNLTDEMLPVTFFDFMQCFLYCFAAVVLVCVTIPWLILLMPPLLLAFYYLRRTYIASSREIKRIEAITRSPIYSDFSATLDGLVTLRAYKLEGQCASLFQQQLDHNGRAWFSFLMISRWLGFRLDLESAVIMMFVSMFAVILRNQVDVGLLGFTLVYTQSLSGLFQWTVRQSAEVESQMTSVERISVYGLLPPEPGYSTTLASIDNNHNTAFHSASEKIMKIVGSNSSNIVATNNSSSKQRSNSQSSQTSEQIIEMIQKKHGDLILRNMTVKYRMDLDPVLKNINVTIPAGYKVGICGRTGSGKSSTLLALLRLNIITEGDILIDDMSLLDMDLETSRSLISIIPQEPHLFSGTVRFNLDPFNKYSDEQIWLALKDAHISDYIMNSGTSSNNNESNDNANMNNSNNNSNKGLLMIVEEGGKNFSVGQRQLLSLARAILRKCKIVLMDEVTASIDFLTDRLIQETIRTSPALCNSTIITVAHRLRTIADSDMIVMVNGGEIVEKGSPVELLSNPASAFRKLAEESNEYEEIFRIASSSS